MLHTAFTAFTAAPTVPAHLTGDYNRAIAEFRSKHERTVRESGAAETDMVALDKAAKLFVAGIKALSDAVNGCHMTSGEVEKTDLFDKVLEGFIEGMPNQGATCVYVEAACRLMSAELYAPETPS